MNIFITALSFKTPTHNVHRLGHANGIFLPVGGLRQTALSDGGLVGNKGLVLLLSL